MAEHYFTKNPASPSDPKRLTVRILGEALTFRVDRSVFSKGRLDPGTDLLIRSLPLRPGMDVLDLGCGWGAVGLAARRAVGDGRVVMVDTNRRALALAARTAGDWGVEVDLREGDGLAALRAEERFDLIATNPPVRAGKEVYYGWAEGAGGHLKEGGAFYAVLRVRQGAKSFERHLQSLFDDVRRQSREGGYWVLGCRGPKAGSVL